jgi:hypothetical protein
LIKTTCQHLLLLVGFDTLVYRKYYDTPPILVGHQGAGWSAPDPVRPEMAMMVVSVEKSCGGDNTGLWWRRAMGGAASRVRKTAAATGLRG